VLKEIQLARALGLEWYYLGLYVGGCRALRYKASYFPHERLIDGVWRRFTYDERDSAEHGER
jgi:arginine-tRNA-protein transferase